MNPHRFMAAPHGGDNVPWGRGRTHSAPPLALLARADAVRLNIAEPLARHLPASRVRSPSNLATRVLDWMVLGEAGRGRIRGEPTPTGHLLTRYAKGPRNRCPREHAAKANRVHRRRSGRPGCAGRPRWPGRTCRTLGVPAKCN